MVEEYLSLRRADGARGPAYNRALRTLVQRTFAGRAEENGAVPGAPAVSINFPRVEAWLGRQLLELMEEGGHRASARLELAEGVTGGARAYELLVAY
jgi:hypothetical protein